MGGVRWCSLLVPRWNFTVKQVAKKKIQRGKTYSSVILFDANLFLADGTPEFNGQLGDILLLVLHAHDREAEEGLLHVETHLIIVGAHDPIQTAKRPSLDPSIFGLSGFANDLHNVIPLAFVLHIR